MEHRRSILAFLVTVAFALAACGGTPAQPPAAPEEAGVVGTNPLEVTVSSEAAQRLGIETAAIAADPAGHLAIPYSAILYDTEGKTWVYEQTKELVYVRTPVDVDAIEGDSVRLKGGLVAGATVVTVGLAELYGAETGVGDPE
jgi:multidrug efflux pump subunit AcrA (membrane-fusion protein)